MRASRIFFFARTRRCAMVASDTRKASAACAVPRPQSVRSVSATRLSSASAGWQQVKISRRRSSGIGPAPSGIASSVSAKRSSSLQRTASSFDACIRWCRMRSMALRRAAVSSQAAGCSGTPRRGQCSSARAIASPNASSARSRSPSERVNAARTSPACSRKTRSRTAASLTRCRRRAAPRSVPVAPTEYAGPTPAPRRGRRTRSGRTRPRLPSSRRTGRR